MAKYFKRYVDKGRKHPFMLTSAAGLKKTEKRLFGDKEPLLVKAHRAVRAAARPEPASNELAHASAEGRATLSAAYLSALHGAAGHAARSAEYAARAKGALLAFAEIGAPDFDSGLGALVHMYLISLAFAYDLVWSGADWTSAEREAVHAFLYSHKDELLHFMHSKHMSNHAAWPMCRLASTAFLFCDDKLARECMDGPDSYTERLAHEFFDDGMSYEQSAWGYHRFSVSPMFVTALAAGGAGADPNPLKLKVKNNKSLAFAGGMTGDYTMPFYPVDEKVFPRPSQKNLRMALTAQFALLRPDTTCPSIGDYGETTPPMADYWMSELAWDFYRDRTAARILSFGSRKASGSTLFGDRFLTLAFGRPLPEDAGAPSKSVIYPQAGYAVLKSVEGDAFWKSSSIHAVLKFGPFGNGHGHADKLHLGISGAGSKTCTEELDRSAADWRYWNSSVSHNTVVVGQKSQPGNEEMFALNDSCGRLLWRRFTPSIKTACAEAPDVYPGLKVYRRIASVTRDYVVDVFVVESKKTTDFDWFLHGKGSLSVKGAAMEECKLPERGEGYEFLSDVKRGVPAGPVTARFSQGHRVFVADAEGAKVFAASGPWKESKRRGALFLRRHGKRAVFTAVHDPSGRAVNDVSLVESTENALEVKIKGRGFVDVFHIDGRLLSAGLKPSNAEAAALSGLVYSSKRVARV